MAAYKVPQDVEAEDKLIGPFSFRQFIYLIVAALGIFMAWLLSRIFIGLFVLPLPIVIAFLALALPLRKDQPMETYLIAMIKFFFKPRNRIWDPEGTISLVTITAPKVTDGPQLKDYGSDEAAQRLAYLAQVVDTHGWSTRGATSANDSMSDIFVAEASHAEDVLDETSGVTQSIDQKITQSDQARMQAVRDQIQAAASQYAPATSDTLSTQTPVATPAQQVEPVVQQTQSDLNTPVPRFNPYPDAIHQHILNPSGQKPAIAETPQSQPSREAVSPDIIRLANNNDLSISAIANEAHRLEDNDNEVVISLR